MVSQEEIINKFVENDGVLTTRDIRDIYNIPPGRGLGHISQRLRQLMKKKIISKVNGLNGEVIYFLIDLSYFDKKKRKKKYTLSNKDLMDIERMIENGYSLKDIANIKEISYRWVKELYRRYRIYGHIFLKRDGRPLGELHRE